MTLDIDRSLKIIPSGKSLLLCDVYVVGYHAAEIEFAIAMLDVPTSFQQFSMQQSRFLHGVELNTYVFVRKRGY